MNIVLACGSGGPDYPWVPVSLLDGVGGSEECAILLAREFARAGHAVVVYNDCREWAGIYDGVDYRHFTAYEAHPFNETDLLISWRNWYLLLDKPARQRWHWTHDQPVGSHCPCEEEIRRPDSAWNHVDKIVFLNNHHRRRSSWVDDEHSLVIGIGVNQEGFIDQQIERDDTRVLYFSHPNRGLDELRQVWPRVRKAVPFATLASFWWEPNHFRPANESQGILPMQRLNYLETAHECLRAGVFGYPSTFGPEISPATTIKAQIGGAMPVAILQGGMVDTVQFGRTVSNLNEFTDALIETLFKSENGELDEARLSMMTTMAAKYDWKNVAAQWLSQSQIG